MWYVGPASLALLLASSVAHATTDVRPEGAPAPASLAGRLLGAPDGPLVTCAKPESPAATSSQKPEDWPRLFERHLNAGDLDAVVALYEPDARFVPKSGDTLVGRDRIRRVLGEMIRAKTRLQSRVVKVVTVEDVAVLYTDFHGTTVDPSGETVEVRNKAIEVLRRQPDGTWKLVVGDPNARE